MGLLLLHEAGHVVRVAGGDDRIARFDQNLADVPERLVVVIHRQDADLFPHRSARGARGDLRGRGRGDEPRLFDRRKGEGKACA